MSVAGSMDSNRLIQMPCETVSRGGASSSTIDIGKHELQGESEVLDMEAVYVQYNERIPMLANFKLMRELLRDLEEASPNKQFLHTWLRNNVGREEMTG